MKQPLRLALLPVALAGAANTRNVRVRQLRGRSLGDDVHASNSSKAAFPEEWLKGFSADELRKSQDQADKWAEEVRQAMLFSWKHYKERALGHDEVRPVSGGSTDWAGMSVTMLDALSTLYLMGLHKEFDDAAKYIESQHMPSGGSHGQNSFFEVTIRALGGLMGAWSLSEEPVFRETGRRLGDNMMPAFNTRSGMPMHSVDIGTGQPSGNYGTILAEAGTVQLEYQALSDATKDSKYINAADKSEKAIFAASQGHGLVPIVLEGSTWPPMFSTVKTSVGASGDSYYEYLLKHWLQTGKKQTELKDKWKQTMHEMQDRLVRRTQGGRTFLATVDDFGNKPPTMDHLSCFVPGMLMLGSRSLPANEVDRRWEGLAAELTETCYQMYQRTPTGLAPEYIVFNEGAEAGEDMQVPGDAPQNMLRPETAEAIYYMHYYTGDPKYRRMAYDIFSAIQKHSKSQYGYAQVADVRAVPATQQDIEPTWWFAETMKYLFLTFAPRDTLNLEQWVLNTEAHPLKIHL